MTQPIERRVAERRKGHIGYSDTYPTYTMDRRTASGDRRQGDAELRGKLKELFAGEPFYEMSTDEVIDHILTLIRPNKPSPEDLELFFQRHAPVVCNDRILCRCGNWQYSRDSDEILRSKSWSKHMADSISS